MPSFYPIKITQAYGVNEEQDWTMPLHGLSQSMRKSRIDYVRTVFPDYDGFGFPLSSLTAVNGRQVGSANKHLPDSIYIYWTSLINMRFFVTKYDLPQKVKEIMAKGVSFERYDGSLGYCFRTEFFFGMLPNGKAKVWLMGCDQLIYLAELEPEREKTVTKMVQRLMCIGRDLSLQEQNSVESMQVYRLSQSHGRKLAKSTAKKLANCSVSCNDG
jgi:Protein of unknown function (DUF2931).